MERSYELILVDDRGPGRAWEIIEQLARQDRAVRGIRMSRNFGQHAAITAGLEQAAGRWAVVMDCDLQDPPENIHRLFQKALEGNDIVYAKRKQKQHSWLKQATAHLYFRVLNAFTKQNIDGEYGSFSLISRRVIDAYLKFEDRERHYLFILYWLGFPSTHIEYEHAQRHSGKSAYTVSSLIIHAINGVFFQTTILLHWIIYAGLAVSSAGLVLAVYFVYRYFSESVLPGWTSLVVLILILGGMILVSNGIIGLYIGRIFDQVKGRPLYVVQETTGSDPVRND
jgi:dolichol-phosphate mannosyltransferase